MIEERYEILKLLGKGRTGGVYEAEDTNLGRKVALRRFFAQTKKTELAEYKEDFEKVTHSLSALQHPNLLRVYDAGVDGDGAYIISQLLEGTTLHDKIEEGALSTYEVYDLAQQMLDALSTSHNEGFVHGAITPGSILMTPRARGGYLYVILDMGLSRLAPLIQGKDSILSIMADPAILAPELFDGGTGTERADLYMFGNILYMCLAGGHPFGGLSVSEAEKMHLAGLPPLKKYNADVPEDFRIWIEKLIEYNPEKRPASAVEALNSLPKVSRPASNNSTTAQIGSPRLNTATSPFLQVPASGAVSPVTASTTGPISGVMPAGTNPAKGVLALPRSNQESSKKALFIILILVALIGVIATMIVLQDQDSESVAPTSSKNNSSTSPGRSSNNAGLSYAERHAVEEEKIIIADFDGTKPEGNNPGWKYTALKKQQAANDGWSISTDRSHSGVKFPLKSNENDMFDLGWKLTYVVRLIKGAHKIGFQMDKDLNPGWEGENVSLYLIVKYAADGVNLSARDSEHKVKKDKSITVPYSGVNGWHTIVIEQKPMDEEGNYTVFIDGKVAFTDTFTKGKDFRGWNNHLFTFGIGSASGNQWVVKKIKLETP